MATDSTSRMLLPEALTGSNDLESYVTHFELLAEIQNWKRAEGDPAREVDERPHYFALLLQKFAIELYRTLLKLQGKIMINALKLFENTIAKNWLFSADG